MRRAFFFLTLGIFCAALAVSAISVYLLHDVDHDMNDRLNEAFAQGGSESVLFALIVGGVAGLLAVLGRLAFQMRGFSPRAISGFSLGIGIAVVQYPWDILTRILVPRQADLSLTIYLVAAIVVSTVVLLLDAYRRKKAFEAARTFSPVQRA